MGRRSHKDEAVVAAHFRELVVFGQKPVAGMDGVNAPRGRCRKNVGDVQIAAVARPFANANRLIGQLNVESVAINGALNRHRGDSHLPTAPQNSESNFAAVGDQHLADGHPAVTKPGRIVSVSVHGRSSLS